MTEESKPHVFPAVMMQMVWLAVGLWAIYYGWRYGSTMWLWLGILSSAGTTWSLVSMARTGQVTWW